MSTRVARPRMSERLYMTQVTKDRRRQIVQKNLFCSLHLENPKDIAIKSEETYVWDRALYHRVNFHASRHEISVPGQKYIFSL